MKSRLFLPSLSVLLILLILLNLVFYLFTVKIVISQTIHRSRDAIAVVHDALEHSGQSIQSAVRDKSRLIPAHIIVVDEQSRLLADSHKSGSVSGQYINSVLSEARNRPFASNSVRHSDNTLLVSTAEKRLLEDRVILVMVTFQVGDVRGFTFLFLVWLCSLGLVFCLLLWLLNSYLLKQYRRPIRKLLQHTSEIARSGFSKISVDTANGELSLLVSNFNALTDRYNLLVENDNKKYSRINTLLANLKNGILMADRNNQIKLVNPRAEYLLDIDKQQLFMNDEGSPLQNELVENILEETRCVNRRKQNSQLSFTSASGLILDITIEAVHSKYKPYEHSGALIIITDVTELRHLEKLKDDFVANVSHELRTPLTVISGFTETLKEWELLEASDRNTALDIIHLETERLKKLISELLMLSRIDGGMKPVDKTSFNPVPVVREVLLSLRIQSSAKELTVTDSFDGPGVTLRGVEVWFRQIIYNICHNAVKFTPSGGLITVHCQSVEGVFTVVVADSGPGIPEKDHEKIFQRFYQLNETANRKKSGSGLGLSIARHMVEEFDGRVKAGDGPLGGALFTVSLPIAGEVP